MDEYGLYIAFAAFVMGAGLCIGSQYFRRRWVALCGQCKHQITESSGMTCPDCGRELLHVGVLRRPRSRCHWPMLATGCLLMLSGIVIAAHLSDWQSVTVADAAGFGLYLSFVMVLPPILLFEATSRLSRPKRLDHPACGNCAYNLTGLTVSRCPECGKSFAEAGVVFQRRLGPPLLNGLLVVCVWIVAVYLLSWPMY